MDFVIAAVVLAAGLVERRCCHAGTPARRGRAAGATATPAALAAERSPAAPAGRDADADLERGEPSWRASRSACVDGGGARPAAQHAGHARGGDRRSARRDDRRGRASATRATLERVAGLSAVAGEADRCSRRSRTRRATTAARLRAPGRGGDQARGRAPRALILSVAMQRLAAGHAAETTVSVVQLPADDMKGRIIGREGRNIRALENLTGVDFIIDDTPNAVVLSALRRRAARDRPPDAREAAPGRPHPPGADRGDLLPGQVRAREPHVRARASRRCFEADVQGLDPELVKLLGRLRFRTSYGQNVLAHSVECAHLAAMMAHELGASAEDRAPRGAAARHRQGGHARDRGPARARRRRPRAPARRDRGRRARDGGPPQRGRAADRRGGDRAGRRRALRRPPGRARRVARALRQAPARPRAASPRATRASTRSTRCRPAARSA